MHYLALLAGEENGAVSTPGTPEFGDAVARHERFWEAAGTALVGGGALYPTAEAVTIRHENGGTLVTDGPFAEFSEVVGGFYVLEADDLDAALELTRQIPDASEGFVELWPMVFWRLEDEHAGCYLAVLREPPGAANTPGSAEWDEGIRAHGWFGEFAGQALRGGGALHPPSSATTVRVRDDELLLTDGPFTEAAEIANGVYLLAAADREAATALAARIPLGPKGCIELRQIVDE
ncbi:hypothetical protein C8K38_11488 [Rhodococcus sp. OK611]|uniref:YciI family protein n=1 Tax=unclassified Rhodococcus (in: high G+C Gram-positive bacteria) TaxID=192944 RepID=UPI000BDC5778|nr:MULTISPECIES: YciI family protein [unclassified Rhodococcus (in: high G+C Gram-positive bacteria)]PTR39984.1 hypothetical protein C8K38_11488 [Rhodococcus sp. OK611]SNX92451.1 Uncharacterized conserved protein [Rhodococcus sp. OK270]